MSEQISLSVEAVIFIKAALAKGGTLSRLLLASHEIANGSLYAVLPPGFSEGSKNDFVSGGQAPPFIAETDETFTSKEGVRWRISPVPNVEDDLAVTIQNFLRAEKTRVCIFEDAVARPTDLRLSSAGIRVLAFNDEVYYWLAQDDAETTSILNTVRQVRSWQHIAVITSIRHAQDFADDTKIISYDALKGIAEEAETIIIGAYDGEGYLIWNRLEN